MQNWKALSETLQTLNMVKQANFKHKIILLWVDEDKPLNCPSVVGCPLT